MRNLKYMILGICCVYIFAIVIPILFVLYRRISYITKMDKLANEIKIFPNVGKNYLLERNITVLERPRGRNFIDNITVVTQLTYERLPRLETLAKRWNSKISAVLYVLLEKLEKININQHLNVIYKHHPSIFHDVDLHLVFGRTIAKEYNLNLLRNIAWNQTTTEFVFLLDIDFMPSLNFNQTLEKIGENYIQLLRDKKLVFGLAAFDMKCGNEVELNTCNVTQPLLADHPSQNATNIEKWFLASEPYFIKYKMLYEPYIIGSVNLPRYDETFDIGNDKVSHSYELAALNYSIAILPKVFVSHLPHNSIVRWSLHSDKYDHFKAWLKFAKFMIRTKEKYHYNHFCEMTQEEEDDAKLPPSLRKVRRVCNNLCTNLCKR